MQEPKTKRARAEPTPAAEPAEPKDNVSSFLQSWAWKREHRPDRDRFQRPYIHSLTLPASERTCSGGVVKVTLEQVGFKGGQGFASTVWDSSIVVAKMLERNPDLVVGRAVLDLSAGCGLVAVVAARLGARRTVATDLGPNLPLLHRNCKRNGAMVEVVEHWWGTDTTPLQTCQATGTGGGGAGGGDDTSVPDVKFTSTNGSGGQSDVSGVGAGAGGAEAARGCEAGRERGSLDVVIACDVMYMEDAVGPLVVTLASLCGGKYNGAGGGGTPPAPPPLQQPQQQQQQQQQQQRRGPELTALPPTTPSGRSDAAATNATNTIAASTSTSSGTTVILAHGRNRFAEAAFWRHAEAAGFKAEAVPWDELDPVYRCTDVDVYRMRLVGRGDGALVE